MNCDQARLQIGAEPGVTAAGLEEHLRGCPDCTRFRDETRRLDDSIRRALQGPPEITGRRNRGVPASRQWALAASVVLALLAGLGAWLLWPSDTLARDVVTHVQAEPDSWFASEHVDAQEINAALRGSGVELGIVSDKVTYAHSCWFHGRYVPHLVVQTAHGPVTVMILRHEQVGVRRRFHEAGMHGLLVPAGGGSIAVLARDGGDVEDLASVMGRDVHLLSPPR